MFNIELGIENSLGSLANGGKGISELAVDIVAAHENFLKSAAEYDAVASVYSNIQRAGNVAEGIMDRYGNPTLAVVAAKESIRATLAFIGKEELTDAIVPSTENVIAVTESIGETAKKVWNKVKEAAKKFWKKIKDLFNKIVSFFKKLFGSSGGGSNGSTDASKLAKILLKVNALLADNRIPDTSIKSKNRERVEQILKDCGIIVADKDVLSPEKIKEFYNDFTEDALAMPAEIKTHIINAIKGLKAEVGKDAVDGIIAVFDKMFETDVDLPEVLKKNEDDLKDVKLNDRSAVSYFNGKKGLIKYIVSENKVTLYYAIIENNVDTTITDKDKLLDLYLEAIKVGKVIFELDGKGIDKYIDTDNFIIPNNYSGVKDAIETIIKNNGKIVGTLAKVEADVNTIEKTIVGAIDNINSGAGKERVRRGLEKINTICKEYFMGVIEVGKEAISLASNSGITDYFELLVENDKAGSGSAGGSGSGSTGGSGSGSTGGSAGGSGSGSAGGSTGGTTTP